MYRDQNSARKVSDWNSFIRISNSIIKKKKKTEAKRASRKNKLESKDQSKRVQTLPMVNLHRDNSIIQSCFPPS